MIQGYGKVWAFGNPNLANLLLPGAHITVQEKVDGSQFSFGKVNGILWARSKGVPFEFEESVDKMFKPAYETAKRLLPLLEEGIVYRCEFLASERHNTLKYGRAPKGFLVLYDIHTADGLTYFTETDVKHEAERLGIEAVQTIWEGPATEVTEAKFADWLLTESALGGSIEGFVIKNRRERERFDGSLLKAKFVRESFKEDNKEKWRKDSPKSGDILEQLRDKIPSQVRWEKAIQHLREEGKLQTDPRDIGPLMVEVRRDAKIELEAQIKELLWNWAWPKIERATTEGFPDWYKEWLMKQAFQKEVV